MWGVSLTLMMGLLSIVLSTASAQLAPQPPIDLRVSEARASRVTFRWTQPDGGPPPTAFIVEGVATPGAAAPVIVTAPAPILVVEPPTGAFFVRVRTQSENPPMPVDSLADPAAPQILPVDQSHLERVRDGLERGETQYRAAVAALDAEAKGALNVEPVSVMDKPVAPPSGNKHDYLSQAPYWWPDPSRPNGRPYIRRDGERNPEIDRITDRANLGRLASVIPTLALAYFFTEREEYAQHVARLTRVWFIDPATRMNPHLRFAQFIPGIDEGRSAGIIETRLLPNILGSVRTIQHSPAWTDADDRALNRSRTPYSSRLPKVRRGWPRWERRSFWLACTRSCRDLSVALVLRRTSRELERCDRHRLSAMRQKTSASPLCQLKNPVTSQAATSISDRAARTIGIPMARIAIGTNIPIPIAPTPAAIHCQAVLLPPGRTTVA